MNARHELSPASPARRVGRYRNLAGRALCCAAVTFVAGDTLAQDSDHQIRCMQLQQELSDVSGVVEESVTGIRVVKGFGVERMQRARLS